MADAPFLSVLVPTLNEGATIERVLDTVLEVPVALEVIVVDDGSTDDTWHRLQERDDERVRSFRHERNQGKGAAVRTALAEARGEYVIVQDADLEYDPQDYPRLLEPIHKGQATVVYGTRGFSSHASFSFWYVVANKAITLFASVLFNRWLSDINTCYKLLPRKLMLDLELRSSGFSIDPEITAKTLRLGHRIYEIPISYRSRTRAEGKKVTAQDGLRHLGTLLRYRWWQPR